MRRHKQRRSAHSSLGVSYTALRETDMIIETRRTRASHQRASLGEGREGLKVGLAAAGVITFLALAVIVFLWLLPL